MESGSFLKHAVPYAVGFTLLALTEKEWITEELTIPVKGHEVAKVVMILFVVYMHAFISLSLEIADLARMFISSEMVMSRSCSCFKKVIHFGMKHSSKFSLVATVIWSAMISKLSIIFWKYILYWHVCSSHNTRCQNFHVGRFARYFKVMVCGEPRVRKSVMCQITMDHAPLILYGLIVILAGYIFFPFLNHLARKMTWKPIKKQKCSNSAKIKERKRL